MPHINFFFITVVLNEYYQYYILSINYYLSLCVSQCIFQKKTTLNNFANYHQNSMQIYREEKRI